MVLLQLAWVLQPPLLLAHSLMSEQVLPLPANPALHLQVAPPTVLVQVA